MDAANLRDLANAVRNLDRTVQQMQADIAEIKRTVVPRSTRPTSEWGEAHPLTQEGGGYTPTSPAYSPTNPQYEQRPPQSNQRPAFSFGPTTSEDPPQRSPAFSFGHHRG